MLDFYIESANDCCKSLKDTYCQRIRIYFLKGWRLEIIVNHNPKFIFLKETIIIKFIIENLH